MTSDSSGSYNVKSVRAGEWLAYTVNIAAAGSYAFDFRDGVERHRRHGSPDRGRVRRQRPIALPDTGGWGVWQTVRRSGMTLPAGTHVLKLVVDANGSGGTVADINWLQVTATAARPGRRRRPISERPIALPNRIEAENYDRGGEGLAYHDTTTGNSSGAYRNDDVDIRATSDSSGGYNIKASAPGSGSPTP